MAIDQTLNIATQGLLSGSPYLISSQGYTVVVQEDIVEVPDEGLVGGGGGPITAPGQYPLAQPTTPKEKKRKRICVTITKDDKEYKKCVLYKELNTTVTNVQFNENNEKDPIKIIVEVKK